MKDMIDRKSKPITPQAQEEMVNVVFTARDIPMRTEIHTDMLAVKAIPKKAIEQMGIQAEIFMKPEETASLFSKVPMVANEILRRGKLTTREEATALSYRIPEGKRAVTVTIDEAKAVGYAIVPDDHVDVIGSFRLRKLVASRSSRRRRYCRTSRCSKSTRATARIRAPALAPWSLWRSLPNKRKYWF